MKAPVRSFIIRDDTGTREAETLVLGRGLRITETAGGLPELEGLLLGEIQLTPSGGDDTQAIRDALALSDRVRLGPGEFRVRGTIAVGTGQSVVGCGPERTTVLLTQSVTLFSLSGNGARVEEMAVVGPSHLQFGSVAVQATSVTGIRLRGLKIEAVTSGIVLSAVSAVEISRVVLRIISSHGVVVTGPGEQVRIDGVTMMDVSQTGLILGSITSVSCTGIYFKECGRGILLSQGSAHTLRSISTLDTFIGLSIQGTQGVDVTGMQILQCSIGMQLVNATAVHFSACTVEGKSPLRIQGGTAVTASGIRTETTDSDPHVLVTNGATQVTIIDSFRVNPATPPTYEVDVSGAGGRVVFIQHNFDPARINSGGNFAAL